MPKSIGYLRSRSLPLLALVEAARLVFDTAGLKCKHNRRKLLEAKDTMAGLGPHGAQPFGKSEQLELEGIK